MLGRRQKLIETSSTIYHEGVPNVVIAPQQVATILLYESIIGSLGKKQSDGIIDRKGAHLIAVSGWI
eukprot:scaffold16040_cov83-Cylindrotheca_fusiformis.AAC.1